MKKNNKIANLIYKMVFVFFIAYSLTFIAKTFFINIQLALLIIPLTALVYFTTYKYLSPKNFSLPQYCSFRNKASYLFLLFIITTLNYIPPSEIENHTNIFTFLPQKSLSNYNIYINYVLIIGVFLIIIPDIQHTSVNKDEWQNSSTLTTPISKVLGIIFLSVLFIVMTMLIYTKELNNNGNIIVQGIFLWIISYMLAIIFIIIKFIIIQTFENNVINNTKNKK